MKTLFGALLAVSQILCAIALYWLTSIALAWVVPYYIPDYDTVSGLSDAQVILLILLLWDRFWGPYSGLLKGVAKVLKQAKKRRIE